MDIRFVQVLARKHRLEGSVSAGNFSSAEETWQTYRYPSAAAVIRAEITLDRYRLLKTIR